MPLTKTVVTTSSRHGRPTGSGIAFHSRRRGGVDRAVDGGTPQQVVEFGSDPAWAPDSATLVFTSAPAACRPVVALDRSTRRQRSAAAHDIGAPAGGIGPPRGRTTAGALRSS